MKKLGIVLVSMLFALSLISFIGCGGNGEGETAQNETESGAPKSYEDGFYFAQEDGFSEKTGWKYVVMLTVEDGKITEATWNGAHKSAGEPKVAQSKSGAYGMVKNGGAQSRWYEQAAKAEQYLLDKQDPTAITYTTDEGHTDAISGVSIHVIEFFSLAEKALENGPVGKGPYKDGHFHAEGEEFSHGWKDVVDLTVLGGRIVAANFNALPEEGEMAKEESSMEGEYGMVENGDAQAPWHEQTNKAEAHLLETQDPTAVEFNDEGVADAISGVSITIEPYFQLAEKALEER